MGIDREFASDSSFESKSQVELVVYSSLLDFTVS